MGGDFGTDTGTYSYSSASYSTYSTSVGVVGVVGDEDERDAESCGVDDDADREARCRGDAEVHEDFGDSKVEGTV